jgi:hypothetical protein
MTRSLEDQDVLAKQKEVPQKAFWEPCARVPHGLGILYSVIRINPTIL